MLRFVVALLLLANLGLWAWQAGVLEGVGLGPQRERDPTRRAQQVRPESIRVVTSTGAALPAPAAASTSGLAPGGQTALAPALQGAASVPGAGLAGACLEAGPWTANAADEAERTLADAGVPASVWQRIRHDVSAQYAVVLGPFNSRESLQAKREELARLRLVGEEMVLRPEGSAANAALRPGLALARYDARPAADAGLASYNQRGVRTARVAPLRSASTEHRLRVAAASPALAEQLRRFSGPAFGLGVQPCEAAR